MIIIIIIIIIIDVVILETERVPVEECSKTNSESGERLKLGSVGEPARKRTKDVTGATCKPKKTKMERSLDVIFSSLLQASETEMKR